MLRILANENFPGEAVAALRLRGHDIKWVRTDAPGISDDQVLALAASEGRTLVTFDKDFGELAFKRKLPSASGIVLFRVLPSSPSRVATLAVKALESRNDWAGHFPVVEETRIRMTQIL